MCCDNSPRVSNKRLSPATFVLPSQISVRPPAFATVDAAKQRNVGSGQEIGNATVIVCKMRSYICAEHLDRDLVFTMKRKCFDPCVDGTQETQAREAQVALLGSPSRHTPATHVLVRARVIALAPHLGAETPAKDPRSALHSSKCSWRFDVENDRAIAFHQINQ